MFLNDPHWIVCRWYVINLYLAELSQLCNGLSWFSPFLEGVLCKAITNLSFFKALVFIYSITLNAIMDSPSSFLLSIWVNGQWDVWVFHWCNIGPLFTCHSHSYIPTWFSYVFMIMIQIVYFANVSIIHAKDPSLIEFLVRGLSNLGQVHMCLTKW